MKKMRLLLFLFLTIVLTACKSKLNPNDDIYVGRVDIIDHIYEGPGNLSLRFYSSKEYENINLIIEEEISHEYEVLLKNHQVKLKKNATTNEGYMHLVSINFFDDAAIDLKNVIMQFDKIYRNFDIGRYQRIDVEKLSGVSLKEDMLMIDFIMPIEMSKSSFIPSVNIDLYVLNKNDYPVLSKNIYNLNQDPKYHLLIIDNFKSTPIIDPSSSKITKNIFLSTKESDYVHIKTYFLYELAYELVFKEVIPNMPASTVVIDLQLVCLEIGAISGAYVLNSSIIDCDDLGVGAVVNYIENNNQV